MNPHCQGSIAFNPRDLEAAPGVSGVSFLAHSLQEEVHEGPEASSRQEDSSCLSLVQPGDPRSRRPGRPWSRGRKPGARASAEASMSRPLAALSLGSLSRSDDAHGVQLKRQRSLRLRCAGASRY